MPCSYPRYLLKVLKKPEVCLYGQVHVEIDVFLWLLINLFFTTRVLYQTRYIYAYLSNIACHTARIVKSSSPIQGEKKHEINYKLTFWVGVGLGSGRICFRTLNTEKILRSIFLFLKYNWPISGNKSWFYFLVVKGGKGEDSLLSWALTYVLFVHMRFLVDKKYVLTQGWKTRKKELSSRAFYALGLQNHISHLCSWCYVSICPVYRTASKMDNSCGVYISGSIWKYRLLKKLFYF
jgi:hypothetical protein